MADDTRIYDAYIAARQSVALAAAVRAGLFDALDAAPCGVAELAARLGLAERPVRLLVRVLRTAGLIVAEGEQLSLAPDAAAQLVSGRPGALRGLIDLEVENFLTPQMLLDALHRDGPSVYGEEDPWQSHARDPARAAAFTEAMHSISSGPAQALARRIDLSDARALLDVGGGSGAVSIALAQAFPQLRCTIWDIEAVCTLAQRYVREAGVADRVSARAGDFFADSFPAGFDVVLLSQILHDWSPETGLDLLRRACAALPAGGRVLVHEKLVGDDGEGPLANALVDLDMLVWTEGQQYTPNTLRNALHTAGFTHIHAHPTAPYWTLTQATKGS